MIFNHKLNPFAFFHCVSIYIYIEGRNKKFYYILKNNKITFCYVVKVPNKLYLIITIRNTLT